MSIKVHRLPQIIYPTSGSNIRPTIGVEEQLTADFVFTSVFYVYVAHVIIGFCIYLCVLVCVDGSAVEGPE